MFPIFWIACDVSWLCGCGHIYFKTDCSICVAVDHMTPNGLKQHKALFVGLIFSYDLNWTQKQKCYDNNHTCLNEDTLKVIQMQACFKSLWNHLCESYLYKTPTKLFQQQPKFQIDQSITLWGNEPFTSSHFMLLTLINLLHARQLDTDLALTGYRSCSGHSVFV